MLSSAVNAIFQIFNTVANKMIKIQNLGNIIIHVLVES